MNLYRILRCLSTKKLYKQPVSILIYTMLALGTYDILHAAPQHTLEPNQWQQIVIPGNSEDSTVRSLFVDSLAADQYDRTWAVFLWNNETAEYTNPGIDGGIPTGQGFWIIHIGDDPVLLDASDLPSTPLVVNPACSSSKGCTEVPLLTAASTNLFAMLGSAQSDAVSTDSLTLIAPETNGACANGCSHRVAADAGLVDYSILRFAWFKANSPLAGTASNYLFSTPEDTASDYFNDFSTQADGNRIHQFVSYRDPFVVAHVSGSSDHASTGGINCSAPEETRVQTRNQPSAHVYQCLPGGNPAAGHQMAYAMNTSGYGFVGAVPDQVFEGIREVSVDINTTSAGSRNFIEIKVLPADQVYVNAMPCIPDLPCNNGWDYDDIGGVGASRGGGMTIATPNKPDGFRYDRNNSVQLDNGDTRHEMCSGTGFCFRVATHKDNISIRDRYKHVFRDNGDGTLSFGVEETDNTFRWVEAPGSFPPGPVRVVIAFHNYTGTKSGNGPGFNNNLSPSTGGFTWHWDNLSVEADTSTPSMGYFGGTNADRIVTPKGCIAFSQGQRGQPHHRDVLPRLHCIGDEDL